MANRNVKIRAGNRAYPVTLIPDGDRYKPSYQFNKDMNEVIKQVFNARWNPKAKEWSFQQGQRTEFQLQNLDPDRPSPYLIFEEDYPLIKTHRSHSPDLYGGKIIKDAQIHAVSKVLHTGCEYLAWEPGAGKTLVAVELCEQAGVQDHEVLYVGVRTAIAAVQREFRFWRSKVWPRFVLWDGLKKAVREWQGPAPRVLILDEFSRAKNSSTQRTQAAQYIADNMREEFEFLVSGGTKCYILGMSGTPAPRDPSDWWSQIEILCPGFLTEGSQKKLLYRLALIENVETQTGGKYPKLLTWWDDPDKCKVCGKASRFAHIGHKYERSTNEVEKLYVRMKGLVDVKFKRELHNLPEKIYRPILVKPTQETLELAKMISQAPRPHMAHRQLADGFQYEKVAGKLKECPACHGSTICEQPILPDDEKELMEVNLGLRVPEFKMSKCVNCVDGQVPVFHNEGVRIACPKDDVLIDLLEENEDIGRILVYAGFQDSVDRCVNICLKQGWYVWKVDGRGWLGYNPSGIVERLKDEDYLELFQQEIRDRKHPKMAYVANPDAGGMAFTLTAASMCVFYSRTDNGEANMQSEDRIHRPGMDLNLGATIVDLIHLPIDRILMTRNANKVRLQNMSKGAYMNAYALAEREIKEGKFGELIVA